MTNDCVYIHEFIDIHGANRANYMHHMTANWCPEARDERSQLCFGVWGTVGSTGRWPEVVNLWELPNWHGLVSDFRHELTSPSMQDPLLAAWWAQAATYRRGGTDRIIVPEPWSPTITELNEQRIRGEVYAHELITTPPGGAARLLASYANLAKPAFESFGVTTIGAFRVAMINDYEAIVITAFENWESWSEFEQAWLRRSASLAPWLDVIGAAEARVARGLMVDAPLSPLRLGRQPERSDRSDHGPPPFDAVSNPGT